MNEMDFADQLKRYRHRRHLTQEELAEAASLSPAVISRLERGLTRAPQKFTLKALCAALALTSDEAAAFVAAARRKDHAAVDDHAESITLANEQIRASDDDAQGLPIPLTPLIGRERDVEALMELLAQPATRLLTLAGARGARVSGLDASPASIAIASRRAPESDFQVGDMEELPFADGSFDAVTGFNSIQFATDPVAALRQALRVCAPGGRVAVVIWGEAPHAEHAATMAAVASLMPSPPPPGAPGPFALSAPGKLEAVMAQAGLRPLSGGAVECPFVYPDAETAWRGLSGAGPYVAAIRHCGEEAVKRATLTSLAPFATPEGGYRQNNTFRYVIASAAAD